MIRGLLNRVPWAGKAARYFGNSPHRKDSRPWLLEQLPKQSVGAEIGVHLGDFSARILSIVQPSRLYLIDPWAYVEGEEYLEALYGGKAEGGQEEMDGRYSQVCDRFKDEIQSGQVVVCRGSSYEMLNALDDDCLDWVYIDGNHTYEFVVADLELSLEKVKPGGLISGDDYQIGGWWEGGVKRAVDEFAPQDRIRKKEIKGSQFILYRSE